MGWSTPFNEPPVSCSGLLEKINSTTRGNRIQKMTLSLIYFMLWMIWKSRNALVFRNERRAVLTVVDDICVSTFNWNKNRSKFKNNWFI